MSGFKDLDFNARIAGKMLDNIILKILSCCGLMMKDCESKGIKIKNHEEQIRNYLLENYLSNNKVRKEIGLEEFLFVPEVPEHYDHNIPKGRVDLKVISRDTFSHNEKYFIIECKRIDGSKHLNRQYIKNGIGRFVGGFPPKYSSFYKRNCMLGFIVKEINMADNIVEINQLHNEYTSNIKVKDPMHADGKFPNAFISTYWLGEGVIKLHHLFYNFSNIIK